MTNTVKTRTQRIELCLRNAMLVEQLQIDNQSSQHSGHYHGDGETHFALLVVSREFDGKSRVQRQRMINELLKQEWDTGLHALSVKTLTPSEYINSKI